MRRYARKLEETYITMRLLVFAYIWAQFREKFEDLWESFKHFQDFFLKCVRATQKTVATHTLQNSNELAFQTDADYMKFKYMKVKSASSPTSSEINRLIHELKILHFQEECLFGTNDC